MNDPRNELGEESAVFDAEGEAEADAAFNAATERGLADAEAGRFVSHEAVKRWLLSWGTDNPLPPPKCGE
ncbi:CopG family transcriptional regulator [Brevundimonas sp.]|uniref:CopG family transcriptional regulator n=1 Tax=Brevundimonas sp. TaxID=1871086 RepID=UPI0035B26910